MQGSKLLKNKNKFFNLLKPKFNSINNPNNPNKNICFIGFQGSNLKKISKYIDIYQKQNYNMTIFTPNYFQNYDQNYVYNAAYKLNEIITKNNKKVTFHVISGGAYPLSVLLNKMILDNNLHLIDKIIYDSSPVPCNFCSAVRALTNTNKYVPESIISKMLSIYLYSAKLPIDTWCHGFYNTLNSPLLYNIDKLFLVSKYDPLIPYDETEEFLNYQKNYQLVKFDSSHAKNILADPKLYEKTINEFINK